MNPLELMQFSGRVQTFSEEHPKFGAFLRDASRDALCEGSVLEIRVTNPEGKEYLTNMRLTENDIETINLIRSLKSGSGS